MRKLLLLLLIVTAPLASRAAPADDSTAVQNWLKVQTGIQHWYADVEQLRALKGLARPLRSAGRAWVSQPQRMRWELGKPPRTIAIRDGDSLIVHYPKLEQTERYGLGDEMDPAGRQAIALLEAGFPRDAQSFHDKYTVAAVSRSEDRWLFELQPRTAAASKLLKQIRLEVAADDWRLLATEFSFPDGSRMRSEFSGHRLAEIPDDRLFQLP